MKNYFLGLDIGTDSVGYAAADTSSDYRLMKYHGEPLWGVTLFEEAGLSDERRQFRCNRRRIDRRQQRVRLVQDIFAREIEKVDAGFYRRIAESALLRTDKNDRFCLFNDNGYTDADYHKKYPTVHHLIKELIESDEPHDVRLVYIACAWLVAHRGHFLSDVSTENVSKMFDFQPIYEAFLNYCREYAGEAYIEPWTLPKEKESEFGRIIKERGVENKKQKFRELLFNGKKMPKEVANGDDGKFPFSAEAILSLLAGGKVKISDLYLNPEYEEFGKISLDSGEEEFNAMLANLGDDGELLCRLKALADWAVLSDLCKDEKYISCAKAAVYEQHKKDLAELKAFVKANYGKAEYKKIFREVCADNYAAYSGNTKNIKDVKDYKRCTSQADFCAFLKKTLPLYKDKMPADMLERVENGSFMPKQVNGDNRVLPYQLYYVELREILKKASGYLPFLAEADENGYLNSEKLCSVMRFRIPYYVGPLNSRGEHAWVRRKAEGKIYPWNFDEKVDHEASEAEFINRMTNTCTYLAGEDVLPKYSLLYQKFAVLNEINCIKICEKPIDVSLKQKIYTELFEKSKRVTVKALKNFLVKNGISEQDAETLSGIDESIKSSLSSHISFRKLLENKKLSDTDVEEIILRKTYCTDKNRFEKWLNAEKPNICEEDRRYISSLVIKDFGRLSGTLLSGIKGIENETGEINTVIGFMWEENVTLSELLLSDRYSFAEEIKKANDEYYGEHSVSLNERLNQMYVSNAVKRPIIRTLEIVSDVVKAVGNAPEKIFVEMARGANENEKHKRTKTRRQSIEELYSKVKSEDVPRLKALLASYGDEADNKLQSDKIYLYFMQLGKCMYTGEPINLNELTGKKYDIDHIYPQSRVDDDSVLNNKVLVLTEENGKKGDKYPISAEIRKHMGEFWKELLDNNLITEEKYRRLTRASQFTADEEWGFVNRQLVETRQSTKVITLLLKEKYPDTEIVFVKAGLVSKFRHEYGILKSRAINDLHHAKDAYLNIVCGQVYHSVFTKKWFMLNRESKEYTLNMKPLFARRRVIDGKEIWNGEKSIAAVKKTVMKNRCHMTVYAFCRHGGLFDQQPLKKGEGLVPRKANLPSEKYGGYQRTTATFFTMALCKYGNKRDILILPVELLVAERFLNDKDFASAYLTSVAEKLLNKKVDEISLPLGKRILKINTVFEVDGFRMCLGGKSSGGKEIGLKPIMPLILNYDWEVYIKRLESFKEKKKKNESIICDAEHDKITAEKNCELYILLADKLLNKPFKLRPELNIEKITEKKEAFSQLPAEEQVTVLLNLISLFSRSAVADKFTGITGACRLSSKLSNWKKSYKSLRVVDTSASGIWEHKSENLLSLI